MDDAILGSAVFDDIELEFWLDNDDKRLIDATEKELVVTIVDGERLKI